MPNHFLKRFDLSKYTLKTFDGVDEYCADSNDSDNVKVNKNGTSATLVDSTHQVPTAVTAATLTAAFDTTGFKIYNLNKASGIAVTLPAASGSGKKFIFYLGATITSNSTTIAVANASDYLRGQIFTSTDNGSGAGLTWPTANSGTASTESDTVTLNGGTTGGHIGDRIELIDIAANVWGITGTLGSTGTEATPFSAAV